MIATFSNKEEYFQELRDAAKDGFWVVRASVDKLQVNSGGTAYAVVSGFRDGENFYEAKIDCGEDWQGHPREGSVAANALIEEIKSLCEELSFTFRGGKWQVR